MGFPSIVPTVLNDVQIPPAMRRSLIELAKGQLLRGTVQRISDSTVWIDVGGQILTAESDIALSPRDQILLNVRESQPGQVTLEILDKITPKPATGTGATIGATDNQTAQLQNLLVSWGFEANETNLELAKAILGQSHSLTAADMQTARQNLLALPNPQQSDMAAIAYLQSNQLPVTEESVAIAKHWLAGLPDIGSQLNTLQQTLQGAVKQLQQVFTQANTAPTPQQAELLTTLQNTLSQLTNMPITNQTTAQEIAGRLQNLVVNLGTPAEANLAGQTQSGTNAGAQQAAQANANSAPQAQGAPPPTTATTPAPANTVPAATTAAPESAVQAATNTTVTETSQAARTILTEASAQTQAQQAEAKVDNPIRQLQATVAKAMAHPGTPPEAMQILQQVNDALDMVAKDMTGIHLSNVAQQVDGGMMQHLVFPIPIQTKNGPQTANLKIFKRPGKKEIDADNARFAILLDLPSLGEIAVDIKIYKRYLSGKFHSGSVRTEALIADNLSDLQANLRQLGYRVESLTSTSLDDGDDFATTLNNTSTAQTIKLTQVDYKI